MSHIFAFLTVCSDCFRCMWVLRIANVKAKHLTPGARKRLSIAEEIVHGPPLLLIDEPLTGLDPKDIAILMNVFREMVNQDRTVVATAHSVRRLDNYD